MEDYSSNFFLAALIYLLAEEDASLVAPLDYLLLCLLEAAEAAKVPPSNLVIVDFILCINAELEPLVIAKLLYLRSILLPIATSAD